MFVLIMGEGKTDFLAYFLPIHFAGCLQFTVLHLHSDDHDHPGVACQVSISFVPTE